MTRWLQRRTVRGQAVAAGGRRLVLLARAWRRRLPGRRGGLVWPRPIGVLLAEPEGTVPIPASEGAAGAVEPSAAPWR